MNATRLTIRVDAAISVSALLLCPAAARALLVLAHGAGAGMEHPSMQAMAEGLATRGIATLRYQFPYMERGMKRTDPPGICHATIKTAVEAAARRLPELPLFAGGKSFGGRMTSQIQSIEPLAGVRGLVLFGFPLHPSGQPAVTRASHLAAVRIPLLFFQGERDKLAELPLLRAVTDPLKPGAVVTIIPDADHSFHVPVRSGTTDEHVLEGMLDATVTWMDAMLRGA